MIFADSTSNQWLMPIAVIAASIIAASGQFLVKKYEMDRQMKTPNHIPAQKSLTDKILFWSEIIVPMLVLLICVWQLVVLLSDKSPPTRSAVFGIVVFIGGVVACSVFLLVKFIFYLVVKKFRN